MAPSSACGGGHRIFRWSATGCTDSGKRLGPGTGNHPDAAKARQDSITVATALCGRVRAPPHRDDTGIRGHRRAGAGSRSSSALTERLSWWQKNGRPAPSLGQGPMHRAARQCPHRFFFLLRAAIGAGVLVTTGGDHSLNSRRYGAAFRPAFRRGRPGDGCDGRTSERHIEAEFRGACSGLVAGVTRATRPVSRSSGLPQGGGSPARSPKAATSAAPSWRQEMFSTV